eukprot:754988-Hanusia_phi.AAC.2
MAIVRYAFCLQDNESEVLEIEGKGRTCSCSLHQLQAGGLKAHQVLFDKFLQTRAPPSLVLLQSIERVRLAQPCLTLRALQEAVSADVTSAVVNEERERVCKVKQL